MTRVTLGKSRVRERRTPGSVRAKAERLSYSTTTWAQARTGDAATGRQDHLVMGLTAGATKHFDRATNAHFRPDEPRGATGKSLIVLTPWLTLNQRPASFEQSYPHHCKSRLLNKLQKHLPTPKPA